MKRMFKALSMSISMFSIFPVFKNIWDDEAMNLVMLCLPIVGAIIGICSYFIFLILNIINIPSLIKTVIIMLCPLIMSGFIHLDGYMDTSDAVLSRRSIDEKRRILKDPLVGAFGVIAFGIFLLLEFSSVHTLVLKSNDFKFLIFLPIVSRSVTGIFLLNMKPISNKGYGSSFKKNTNRNHTIILLAFIILSFLIGIFLIGVKGLIISIITIVSAIISAFYLYKQLDGISGDLCGFIITISELFGYIFMAIIA